MDKQYSKYCKRIFATLLFLLIFGTLNAQVIIEEEIEINPKISENKNSLEKTNATMLNLNIEAYFNTGSYPFPLPPADPYTTGHVQTVLVYRNKYHPNRGPYEYNSSIDGFVSITTQVEVGLRDQIIQANNRVSNIGHSLNTPQIRDFVGDATLDVTITVSGAPSGKRILINNEPKSELVYRYNYYGSHSYPFKVTLEDDPCELPTVGCSDYESQIIDESNFVVLKENEEWQWTDENGGLQTANTGLPCDYIKHPTDDKFGGVTFVPYKIGDHSSASTKTYKTLEDIDISVCLDNRNPGSNKWQFNLDNIKIPIIKVVCTDKYIEDGYTDLVDGTNGEELSRLIKSCSDLGDLVLYIDEYLKIGPYRNQIADEPKFVLYPHKIIFSSALLHHENLHEHQHIENMKRNFNGEDGLQKIRNENFLLDTSLFPCPEDAINSKKTEIKDLLKETLRNGADLDAYYGLGEKGVRNVELAADRYTEAKYEEIKQNIMTWAKGQPWWDPNDIFCAEVL